VGDVTEEQRKAIVEMAAIVEFGRGFVPPLSYERACEEWKEVASLAKRDLRWDAIAVLESVGYFKLVEAAETLIEAYGEHRFCPGTPNFAPGIHIPCYWSPAGKTIDTELVVALEAALKEAV